MISQRHLPRCGIAKWGPPYPKGFLFFPTIPLPPFPHISPREVSGAHCIESSEILTDSTHFHCNSVSMADSEGDKSQNELSEVRKGSVVVDGEANAEIDIARIEKVYKYSPFKIKIFNTNSCQKGK